ncbi:MAG TPA: TRAP transporter substrate-binding protein DctP [Elusimicrobiales bacterium]|nr:TRAP transporter substrate-binding protein DctP [Elusimicrobiales bacterium]
MKFFKYTGLLAVVFLFCGFVYSKPIVIKFATLAPKGSTWMQLMDELAGEVFAQTDGEVKFKIYSGGVHGDEKDVVRKIRFGQLHSGGFTGVGLGIIAEHLRILDTPFLFNSEEEIDYIYKKFDSEFRDYLKSRGFILLGWAQVGFVYLFTNKPVREFKDLSGIKMWMWEGDPVAESTFSNLGVSAVSLSITDVMTSLQTGLIEGVYGSPLSITALQWFTKVKYMFSLRVANAGGAVLISEKKFNSIKPNHQKILLDISNKYFKKLTALSRRDDKKAVKVLKEEGILVTSPASQKVIAKFKLAGAKTRIDLADKLYPKSLLIRIEKALEDFRASKKNKNRNT